MHIGGATTKGRPRLPPYWFESRRRYFALTYGVSRAILIDLVAIGAHLLGAAKRLIPGRQYLGRPHFIRDLLHHSVLWRRNRDIPPVSSRIASSMRPAETSGAATQART